MKAYYNEFDPGAAAWLRELIKIGAITDGVVDERSIEDVEPDDLRGFNRVHFFAGIGVWDHALNLAGWGDRPVWTGSCPCQPFSAAGKGGGFADERHLWPAFQWLIDQCRPAVVFGEQVASKATEPWIDLVHADLEGMGYAFGCVPFPSAGVGAPHLRDRAFWVADSEHAQRRQVNVNRENGCDREDSGREKAHGEFGTCGEVLRLANSNQHGCHQGRERLTATGDDGFVGDGSAGGLANANEQRICGGRIQMPREGAGQSSGTTCERPAGFRKTDAGLTGPTNGLWRDVDWLFCRDGKWRPVESLDEQMADGFADRLGYRRFGGRYSLSPLKEKAENRVIRLRGYGNAINAGAARIFIESFMVAP